MLSEIKARFSKGPFLKKNVRFTEKYSAEKDREERLKDKILFMGYAKSFEDYATWLWKAHILPVTSNQDFFGGSVVEAIYCNCYPILPNRLAYPEHLQNKEENFYTSFEQLCQKLEKAILNFNNLEIINSFVKKYDWQSIVKKYDERFLEISK